MTKLVDAGSFGKADKDLRPLPIIPQPIKQVVFKVEAEDFCRSGECKNFQIGKLWDDTSARCVYEVIYTISCKFFEYVENFSELYDEVVHKRDDSNQWFGRC